MGDLNARIGKSKRAGFPVARHGEESPNSNGSRIIDFCLKNNFVICNTSYNHRDIHKYTKDYAKQRGKIDYRPNNN